MKQAGAKNVTLFTRRECGHEWSSILSVSLQVILLRFETVFTGCVLCTVASSVTPHILYLQGLSFYSEWGGGVPGPQPALKSRMGKSSTFLIFPRISIKFSLFSSKFSHFIPHLGSPGGRVAHPGRPWLRYWGSLNTLGVVINFWNEKIGGHTIFDEQNVGNHKTTTDSLFLFKKTDFNTVLACLGGKVYRWWLGQQNFCRSNRGPFLKEFHV